MGNEPGGLQLLKADKAGRVRMPADKRQEILAEFDRCGVSGAAFAKMIGVKYSTFASWAQRHRRVGSAPTAGAKRARARKPMAFVEARAVSPVIALELELPGQIRVRLSDPAQIPLAVALLRGVAGC